MPEISGFDEMQTADGVRSGYETVARWLEATSIEELSRKQAEAENIFRRLGVTFAVYGQGGDPDRLIPFDLVPRVFSAAEWDLIDRGVKQRAEALNRFIHDVYNGGEAVSAGIVPASVVQANDAYLGLMEGFTPPQNVYAHIIGVDLVRTGPDEFFVLEDNCRTPSGVSYMLENRAIMTRLFPDLFSSGTVRPVDSYPDNLKRTLIEVAPDACEGAPKLAVLTPGSFNSAYYEHSFLADEMGVPLVEGPDLVVEDDRVYMRTTLGLERIDVLYRRIDDAFLDPDQFRPDSALGVRGLMQAYLRGGVTLVNAPGGGIADDKAIYSYMPDLIRFYLGQEPLLSNVETWRCAQADHLAYALEHMSELVFKEVHGSGGYGMLIGPAATRDEIEAYRARIMADPSAFIAQPTLALSSCPTFVGAGIAPRHVDFRPFVLTGRDLRLTPGGLTRVALREGSLVVNSSQGGGVKDTWVMTEC